MSERNFETQKFSKVKDLTSVKVILKEVFNSLEEKGYEPYDQIIGYILSGDPTYITSYNNARAMIKELEREDLLEELLKNFLEDN
ncbi:MAG: IreB family regulatory phosphoprotein [Tissierellia bacterium]|nr:IreB family regulatory phosphoprotein [Tissierellia bacterium]